MMLSFDGIPHMSSCMHTVDKHENICTNVGPTCEENLYVMDTCENPMTVAMLSNGAERVDVIHFPRHPRGHMA